MAKLTRRDYVEIADIFRDEHLRIGTLPSDDESAVDQVEMLKRMTYRMADHLESRHSNFDRGRFLGHAMEF